METRKYSHNEIFMKAHDLGINEGKQHEDYINKYQYQDHSLYSPMDYLRYRAIVDRAYDIADFVIKYGGTKEEVYRVLKYLMVCIDSEEYFLDHRKAYEDLKIRDLTKKIYEQRKMKRLNK